MGFTLYTYFRSSAAYRTRIALNVKGIAYESTPVHLRRQEHRADGYTAMNPQALVPTLEHDGAAVPQSLAIIEYLEEIHPEPPLLPARAFDRAIVRSMAQLMASEIHPLCNLRVLAFLREQLGHSEEQVQTWCRHWISAGLESLERMVGRYSETGQRCFGTALSVADVCLVPQLFSAVRFGCDLERYPKLQAIGAALESLPAFAAAHPSAQADAE